MAGGAEVGALDPVDARLAQRELRRAPEVEVTAVDDALAEPGAVVVADVRADLVAARPDPRADRCGERPVAERLYPGRDDALQEPEPADVQQRQAGRPVRARQRDR